jgi:RNA polymerase sigma-70 factor (ECF subfamily)
MLPPVLDDRAALDAWRAGDHKAGRALVERHFAAIYRFFANKLGTDVDDLVQQTFLAAVEGRERVRDAAGFRPYLFGIARNRLMRHFRDRGPMPDDCSVGDLQAATQSIAQLLVDRREQRLLLAALRRLPIDLQIAVELAYWEGLTDREVAEILEVPMGTFKSRLRKARQMLAESITALAGSPELALATLDGLDGWVASVRAAFDDAEAKRTAGIVRA